MKLIRSYAGGPLRIAFRASIGGTPGLGGDSKPTIPEVIDQFRSYHATHEGWGSLHVVLEDGNYQRHHVSWCAGYATGQSDHEGAWLAEILLRMSITQRRKIARIA